MNKILVIISIVVLILIIYSNIYTYADETKANYKTIIVKEGDTLWGIAQRFNNKNEDVRKVVYIIKKFNGLNDAVIYPGQELKIPVE